MQVMDATNRDPGFGVLPAQDDSPEERARVGRDYLQARFGNIPDVRRAFALVDGRTDFPELVALFKQVRAYQGTLRLGLDHVPRKLYLPPAQLEVIIDYNRITPLQRLLPEFSASIERESFGTDAVFRINLPAAHVAAFSHALTELAEGAVLIEAVNGAE